MTRRAASRQGAALVIAATVAVLWHLIWRGAYVVAPLHDLQPFWFADLMVLAFSLVLVSHAPRASGLTLGRIREHWQRVLVISAIPVLCVLIVYPRVAHPSWSHHPASIWAVQPIAQDVLFFGFVYRVFDEAVCGRVVPWLPVEKPLLLTSLVFSLWHLPNVGWMGSDAVALQLTYTFAGGCLMGLIRQWTGSLLYLIPVHVLVNYIAWSTP